MAQILHSHDAQWNELRVHAFASVANNYVKTGTAVASDAAEATTTSTVIKATAHVAQVGDQIIFTSGAQDGEAREVSAIATNTITVSSAFSGAPVATDTFNIIRPQQQSDQVGAKLVIFRNTMNQPVYISFNGTTNHLSIAAGEVLQLALKAVNLHLGKGVDSTHGFIYVKVKGTAPTSGDLEITTAD